MTPIVEWETTVQEGGEDTLSTYMWALNEDGTLATRMVETMDADGHVEFVGEEYHVVARIKAINGSRQTACERYITHRYHHTLQKVV